MRIINEPTAAAVAYGLEKMPVSSKARTVLVFDLGGGTFDVSILNIDPRAASDKCVFDVKAITGDTHLGGADLDTKMVEYSLREFARKQGNQIEVEQNKKAKRRLRNACETTKRMLSSMSVTQTNIIVDSLHDGIDLFVPITRSRFEELNRDLFSKCLMALEKCLSDAKVDKSNVDNVVLVGGSTRIPKVKNMLQEFFNWKEPCQTINPDEAVAYGAAIQAYVLGGKQTDDQRLLDILLCDVTPFSLGIETNDDCGMSVVIPRNTATPTTKMVKGFTTSNDNATCVSFQVYEGESTNTKDNNLLGEFVLTNIPPVPKGEQKMDVTFDIDVNGVLVVSAVERGTVEKNSITIVNHGGRLRKDELVNPVQKAEW